MPSELRHSIMITVRKKCFDDVQNYPACQRHCHSSPHGCLVSHWGQDKKPVVDNSKVRRVKEEFVKSVRLEINFYKQFPGIILYVGLVSQTEYLCITSLHKSVRTKSVHSEVCQSCRRQSCQSLWFHEQKRNWQTLQVISGGSKVYVNTIKSSRKRSWTGYFAPCMHTSYQCVTSSWH